MPKKSLSDKLNDALESGNLELAKSLTVKLKNRAKVTTKPLKPPKIKHHKEELQDNDEGDIISRPQPQNKEENDERLESKGENKICRTEPFNPHQVRINKFKDTLKDCSEDIGVVLTRKIVSSRPKFKKVKAQCRACGRTEMVAPQLVSVVEGEKLPSYRCNKCCSSR